jgi:2-oxoglutarate ferredoxin oxidoreductase subunit gamma
VDSSLIQREAKRGDVTTYAIPATKMASDAGLSGLANMVMVGKVIKETGIIPYENIERALKKVVSTRHQDLAEANLKALAMGYQY